MIWKGLEHFRMTRRLCVKDSDYFKMVCDDVIKPVQIMKELTIPEILYNNITMVETEHKKTTDRLGWKWSDVLYSFLGVYVVGLKIYCSENESGNLKKIWSKEYSIGIHQHEYSRKFILEFVNYYSAKDKDNKIKNDINELKELKEINDFISVYSSIGNVFPIWPGGNEHRGKNGCYDIPDIYFNKEGIHNYSEHFFNTFCTNNFMENIRYGKYSTLTRESMLKFNREEYKNFLIYIHDTICEREEKINMLLK